MADLTKLFFDDADINELSAKKKGMDIDTVVFCSFENRYAKSGGLGSVTCAVLPHLAKKFKRVILFSPYYENIFSKIENRELRHDSIFPMDFFGTTKNVSLFSYSGKNSGFHEYYIRGKDIFSADNSMGDPYLYSSDKEGQLKRDSLFFCKAVPAALANLGIKNNFVLHLNEWQTSLVSLTAKDAILDGTIDSCKTFMSVHNPFDSCVSVSDVLEIVSRDKTKDIILSNNDFFKNYNSMTAYGIGLGLLDIKPSAVSKNFAKELGSDLLFTKYFAPHLQDYFKDMDGVNNGHFVSFSERFPKKEKHTLKEIENIKSSARGELLNVLDTYKPDERFGDMTYQNRSILELPENIPILVMNGRLDMSQKGYDVLLEAIKYFPTDKLKVVFTPIPVNRNDLEFFKSIADCCRGNVTVFPMRMSKGYEAMQTGATFAVMPSIYEPFGMAIEYLVRGTPVISRKTGGLVNQTVNCEGLNFRENDDFYNLKNINSFFLDPKNRPSLPWFVQMTSCLKESIDYGIRMFQNDKRSYYKIIREGFKKGKEFEWNDTINDFKSRYDS